MRTATIASKLLAAFSCGTFALALAAPEPAEESSAVPDNAHPRSMLMGGTATVVTGRPVRLAPQ